MLISTNNGISMYHEPVKDEEMHLDIIDSDVGGLVWSKKVPPYPFTIRGLEKDRVYRALWRIGTVGSEQVIYRQTIRYFTNISLLLVGDVDPELAKKHIAEAQGSVVFIGTNEEISPLVCTLVRDDEYRYTNATIVTRKQSFCHISTNVLVLKVDGAPVLLNQTYWSKLYRGKLWPQKDVVNLCWSIRDWIGNGPCFMGSFERSAIILGSGLDFGLIVRVSIEPISFTIIIIPSGERHWFGQKAVWGKQTIEKAIIWEPIKVETNPFFVEVWFRSPAPTVNFLPHKK